MKKLFSIILSLCMLLSVLVIPVMAEDVITVTVNTNNVDCAKYGMLPVIVEGRTLVPLRAVFEAIGAEVEWDNDKREVLSQYNGITITLAVDSTSLFVNGEEKTIDVPAQLINDRTMVPVRAVAEAFGCRVEWDNDLRCVKIYTNTFSDADADAIFQAKEVFENAWTAIVTGDFESAQSYFAEEINFDESIETVKSAFVEYMANTGMTDLSEEQAAQIDRMIEELIYDLTGVLKYTIDYAEVTGENTVTIDASFIIPDTSNLSFEQVLTDEAISKLVAEALGEGGNMETLVRNVIKKAMAMVVDAVASAPVIEESLEITVINMDGTWLILD